MIESFSKSGGDRDTNQISDDVKARAFTNNNCAKSGGI